jgi:hypothetical protein
MKRMKDNRDWMLNDYLTADDSQLQEAIGWQEELIEELEASIVDAKNWIRKYKAQIASNHRNVFWDAHPELLRLEIGDELLVTQEFMDFYQKELLKLVPVGLLINRMGRIGRIKVTGANAYVSFDGVDAIAPLDIAIRMRQAWLDRQGQ